MTIDLHIVLKSILAGGLIRVTVVALSLAAAVILTVVGYVRKNNRCSLWLLYGAGIAFLVGIISGTARAEYVSIPGVDMEANPIFELLAGLLAYTIVAITALIGSLIIRISQPTSAGDSSTRGAGLGTPDK